MRSHLWHAPALLLLYQAAPISAGLDEVGRFRVALGLGSGRYYDRTAESLNCAGEVIEQSQESETTYQTIGVQAAADLSPKVRVSAAGGLIPSKTNWTRGVETRTWSSTSGYGSLMLSLEEGNVGFGAGVGVWPRPRQYPDEIGGIQWLPNWTLRIGPAEQRHFRFEGGNAMAAPGSNELARLGFAGGYRTTRQASWFVGGSVGPGRNAQLSGSLGFWIGGVQPIFSAAAGKGWYLGLGIATEGALSAVRPKS